MLKSHKLKKYWFDNNLSKTTTQLLLPEGPTVGECVAAMYLMLSKGVLDELHIGKAHRALDAQQQHSLRGLCLWVLLHAPAGKCTA